MNIVVLVKQVPDTWAERKLQDSDKTLDRASVDVVMNEIDEYAVEEALKIKEASGGEVTVSGRTCAAITGLAGPRLPAGNRPGNREPGRSGRGLGHAGGISGR